MEGLLFGSLQALPGFNLFFGDGAGGTGSTSSSVCSEKDASVEKLDICRLHPRFFAVGKPWDRRTEREAKRNNASELGEYFRSKFGEEHVLFMNLCAQNSANIDHSQLAHQVVEVDFESHPTIEAIFMACHSAFFFLNQHPNNVIAIFCKNGVQGSRLFVSCFLTMLGRFKTTHKALEYFYFQRARLNYDAQHILRRAQPSLRHFLDKFQLIYQNGIPQDRPSVIYMICLENLPKITENGLMETNLFSIFGPSASEIKTCVKPIVRVYQSRSFNKKRALVFNSAVHPASCVHWNSRDGKLMLKVDCEVFGDVQLEAVFPGNTKKHLFKYNLHTGFLKRDGVFTVDRRQIDSNLRHVFHEDFKMDLVVQPERKHGSNFDPSAEHAVKTLFLQRSVSREIPLKALTSMHVQHADSVQIQKLERLALDLPVGAKFALQRCNNNFDKAKQLLEEWAKRREEENGDEQPSRYQREVTLPFIKDEEMTSELVKMLAKLDETKNEASPKVEEQAFSALIESTKEEKKHDKEKSDCNPNTEKFRKMLKMGVPTAAVANKMKIEGFDPTSIGLEDSKSSVSKKASTEDTHRFRKMLKMGVAEGAVIKKMEMEGLDPSTIGLVPNSVLTPHQSTGKRSRRKKIHWEAIPSEKVTQGSIWSLGKGSAKFKRSKGKKKRRASVESTGSAGLISPSRLIHDEMDPDMKELESLFIEEGENSADKAKKPSRSFKSASTQNRKLSLLSAKRAQNIAIGLKKIRLESLEICRALNEFDDKVLDAEKLQIIQANEMIPTQEEEKTLSSFLGDPADLAEADAFMLSLANRVEAPQRALSALLFKSEFHEKHYSLLNDIVLIQTVCNQIKGSKLLQKLLQVVLLVGNKINSKGDQRIEGFTVESLLKLSQTKSFNRKTTILDFVAQFVVKRTPEVVEVDSEIPGLASAKRIQLGALAAEQTALHKGSQVVRKCLKEGEDSSAKLESFSREVSQNLDEIRDAMEASKQAYFDLLVFFCESSDKPSHEFFGTLEEFLRNFKAAAKSFQEKERRKMKRSQSSKTLPRSFKQQDTKSQSFSFARRVSDAENDRSAVNNQVDEAKTDKAEDSAGRSKTPALQRFLRRNPIT